uniref:F-box domain-containing protein n=1 Tax=Anopheles coluzzii TaxID=1518534 RepID=A0A8W7PJ02_ANOCL
MEPSDAGSPFDKLSPELIFFIFDHLNLESLKAVSLTCHRLEEMFADYSARRFVLSSRKKTNRKEDLPPLRNVLETMEEAVILLQRTKRSYRRFHLDVRCHPKPGSLDDVQAAHDKLLATRLIQQLVVLKLDLGYELHKIAVKLSGVVTKMESLQVLYIGHEATDNPYPFSQLSLVNRSLQKLLLSNVWPGRIDCPKMGSLNVSVLEIDLGSIIGKQYVQHGGQEPYWKLKQLSELVIQTLSKHRSLSLLVRANSTYGSQFYRQLTQLTILQVHPLLVTDETLQAIGETCVQLERLSLSYLRMINPASFHHLSNLTNLRHLAIKDSNKMLSFAGFRMPLLERLELGDATQIDWPSLAQFASIECLLIRCDSSQLNGLCDLFAERMRRLHTLWLKCYSYSDRPRYRELAAALPKLPALETLVLETSVYSNCFIFLKTIEPMLRLTRLIICSFPSRRHDIGQQVATLLPNVPNIEIRDLHDVYEVRKSLKFVTMD